MLAVPALWAAACAADTAPADPADPPASGARDAPSPSTISMAVGGVHLEIDDADLDKKLGPVFADGVKSGASNCYIEALMKSPGQEGEIAFVVKPPPKEGPYVVALAAKGSLSSALVTCVRTVFGSFYHYADHFAFDQVQGTLRFMPEMIAAPMPPPAAALRAILDQRYATQKIVRVSDVTLKGISHDVDSYSGELFRHYYYDVDLEFIANGYQATCHHYATYLVFGTKPYRTPFAGHHCENTVREIGDHTIDSKVIDLRLSYRPSVAKSWEIRGDQSEQTIGTRPAGPGDD
jgi:hypothetical protein